MKLQKGKRGEQLKEKIPIGSLVRVTIFNRITELAIVIDYNYGLYENSWYFVHGLATAKEYMAYPHEIVWLRVEDSDPTEKKENE